MTIMLHMSSVPRCECSLDDFVNLMISFYVSNVRFDSFAFYSSVTSNYLV